MTDPVLLHIIHGDEWATLANETEYRTASLDTEGFIHCSYPFQVLTPANERFHGVVGLLLLTLDPEKLNAPLVVEDSYGGGVAFPHIYGPIPLAAITGTIDFPCEPDGSFRLPAQLAD